MIKVEVTIEKHVTEADLRAAALEKKGHRFANGNGGYFDHVTEVENAGRGLANHVESLENSLRNPNLHPEARSMIQESVSRAKTAMTKIQGALSE